MENMQMEHQKCDKSYSGKCVYDKNNNTFVVFKNKKKYKKNVSSFEEKVE